MKTENPQAYPTLFYDQASGKPNGHDAGMTLRDYFANSAMQGFVSDREMYMAMMHDRTLGVSADDYIAIQSYNLADAMLKQREL